MATATSAAKNASNKTRPVHCVRIGRVEASVWESVTDRGTRYRTSLRCSYKQDDEWKTTHSFSEDEILVASKALELCFLWIAQQRLALQGNK